MAPSNTVVRRILTPSSTTTLAPRITFGPILQFLPILTEGSMMQFPMIPAPEAKVSGFLVFILFKYKHIPVR